MYSYVQDFNFLLTVVPNIPLVNMILFDEVWKWLVPSILIIINCNDADNTNNQSNNEVTDLDGTDYYLSSNQQPQSMRNLK
jgi:hypothetical protein